MRPHRHQVQSLLTLRARVLAILLALTLLAPLAGWSPAAAWPAAGHDAVAGPDSDPLPSMTPVSIAPAPSLVPEVADPSPLAQPSPVAQPSAAPSEPVTDAILRPTPPIARASELALPDPADSETSITIRSHICPAGYDPFGPETDLAGDCIEPGRKISYEIRAYEDIYWAGTQSDENGLLTFGGLDAGRYFIAQEPPTLTDYSLPVGCGDMTSNATARSTVIVTRVELLVILDAGADVVCDWYIVPEAIDPAALDPDLIITKWTCPPSYDPDAPAATPATACDLTDGVEFSVELDDREVVADSGNVGLPGQAYLFDLPPGTWTVSETLPAGVADSFQVRCEVPTVAARTADPDTRIYDPPADSAPSVDITITNTGLPTVCQWFNEREAGSTLTVAARRCPVGFDLLGDQDSVATACQDPADGVTFTVSDATSGDVRDDVTGQSDPGVAMFAGLPSGTWSLTMVDAPYLPYAAWRCHSDDDTPASLLLAGEGQPVTIDALGAITAVTCDWYLIPVG